MALVQPGADGLDVGPRIGAHEVGEPVEGPLAGASQAAEQFLGEGCGVGTDPLGLGEQAGRLP